jgi:hypothetical protein
MHQIRLPFKFESSKHEPDLTALAGLPLFMDLAVVSGMIDSMKTHLTLRTDTSGWTDDEVVLSLVLLNLAGGDCVDDIKKLESDRGFRKVMRKIATYGMSKKEKKAYKKRWRTEKKGGVPSPSAIFRYLNEYHDENQEKLRPKQGAFIPKPTENLRGLCLVNRSLIEAAQRRSPQSVATIDMDATLVASHKEETLYCYKGFKAYQPLNSYWYEQGLTVHSEFRDGNVPAGYEQLRVFKETLRQLPEGVEEVFLRSDTAGYQINLLKYCAEGKDERFGEIKFAIGVDVVPAFKQATLEVSDGDWHRLYRSEEEKSEASDNADNTEAIREWAEVCYVPNSLGSKKDGPTYRFLAIRERIPQLALPGTQASSTQLQLPFATITFPDKPCSYKLFGLVTNYTEKEKKGDEVIRWNRQRCGKSEGAHTEMKHDLAGGRLPSHRFGANAAWWAIMILALNLSVIMKRQILPRGWARKRMKAIRYALINLPGRVMNGSREFSIRLCENQPSLQLLLNARETIYANAHSPPMAVGR